ncbi:MAG: hypothetical protein A3F47_02065 [Candidatus Staskawiczbacteria bacterium RIFCSPHIGHO2_12_FULL_38_11]|uniref:SHSP domain-containing protein n=1 Tax=Candidatus Staskawiczbacteria bacterium RIFCSPHIGHO2_12_FULL_38_11 TaxID=1802209 RepID=A0A1G2I3R5_9BACT|nr:MAG: hypothetical protein A3F47_02065 [Candidatus Staskawiczbacteria bacterium RIFCSPHIGHO2_12_FULL_38_11]
MPRKTKSKTEKVSVKTEEKKEIIPEQKPEEKIEETAIFNSEGELVVDVFETNDHFVVLTAIAGVNIKDLDISVEKDMMVIKGQRQDPHNDHEKKYFYQECYWGPFSRKVVLPENIKTEEAEAQMDKGMLVIKIPKITS